ncbi:MAG: hypothetical protein LIP18_02805, partial [Planctomycetes bacterium]|nr:hypothetical protein [Planctomycetota bacterium]
ITLGRTVGGFLGAAILLWISTRSLNIFIGVSTILAAVASLAAPSFRPGLKSLLGAGFITGVTETATGIGGRPWLSSTSTIRRRRSAPPSPPAFSSAK